MTDSPEGRSIAALEGVTHHFVIGAGKRQERLAAVSDVSLAVRPGEILGIVGESGSGKTTVGRILAGILAPTFGRVLFENQPLTEMSRSATRAFRRQVQVVFQDTRGSLNPRMRVRDLITEPWVIHGMPADPGKRLVQLLESVGLSEEHLERFPSELSGGQRQRVGIARALACAPRLLICDEAVASLDVSVQAQVLALLSELNVQSGLTIVFIAHDISVVRMLCHRIAVMHLGSIVETGRTERVCASSRHPYTAALLSAVPTLDGANVRERIILSGELPSPLSPPSGCTFRTRCWRATDRCAASVPAPVDREDDGSFSCFFPLEEAAS